MNTQSHLPGGIVTGTEFFTVMNGDKREVRAFYNRGYFDFATIPSCRKEIVARYLAEHPVIDSAMQSMAGTDLEKKIERTIMCRFGALNREPDIDDNGNLSMPEYVPCAERSTCRFEGIGCCNIMVRDGQYLSKAETQVFVRVNQPDKIIADALFISVETVKTHFRNIRNKTGLSNKIEMAIWATQKGII